MTNSPVEAPSASAPEHQAGSHKQPAHHEASWKYRSILTSALRAAKKGSH
jgi:hypothetical protein